MAWPSWPKSKAKLLCLKKQAAPKFGLFLLDGLESQGVLCLKRLGSKGLIANQIILFIFALTIYDEFDANAIVTDRIITTRSFRQL